MNDQLDAGRAAHAIDGALRIAVAEVEAELGVVLAGGDELVGMRGTRA
jgi:hypothetical protein